MAHSEEIVMLCGRGDTNDLAQDIITAVNTRRVGQNPLTLAHTDFGWWPDSEPDFCFDRWEDLRDKHVVFFLSTHKPHLALELLILIRAIKKRYGAKSLTVVQPFMAFRRQDHPEINEEFDLNLWFIENIKSNGADRLIICDIHSQRTLENCEQVGLEVHHVKPTPLYVAALKRSVAEAQASGKRFKVLSPDKGSLLRAAAIAKSLGVPVVLSLKKRKETGNIVTNVEATPEDLAMIAGVEQEHQVKVELISIETVRDAHIVIREDELDTGRTAADTCRDLLRAGAYRVELVVTHMKCSHGWKRTVGRKRSSPFCRVLAGDTIHRSYEDRTGGLVENISVAPVIAAKLAEILENL